MIQSSQNRSAPARRAALAAIAVGSLFSLAACGGDTSAAAGGNDDGGSGEAEKTIVFSPLGLQIPAMKQLSEGVQHYGESKGYEVTVQDPKLDPQKQVTDLQSVIETGAADGVWSIAIAPPSMTALVQTALEKRVPIILNGTPEDYGLDGLQPGVSFSTIDYEAQGQAAGEELGNCINEKYDGKGQVLFAESAPGTAGKEQLETAVKEALAATAPDAEIVTTITVSDRTAAQTDVGSALQGNPGVNAVFGQNDEGALGAIGAFKAAGKDAALHHRGRRQRGEPGRGRGRRHLRRRRAAVRRGHGAVVRRPDGHDRRPGGRGRAADRAAGSRQGRGLSPRAPES